jgi:hypothetical protein
MACKNTKDCPVIYGSSTCVKLDRDHGCSGQSGGVEEVIPSNLVLHALLTPVTEESFPAGNPE